MKSYTDLEQSKKLAKILPLESADMEYMFLKKDSSKVSNVPFVKDGFEEPECCYTFIPCWSLAALLKLIPEFNLFKRTIECRIETTNHFMDKAWDLVDAAFEMVCWLKENNKI